MTLTLTKQEAHWGWLCLLGQFLVIPFAVSALCAPLGISSEAVINQACFLLNAALSVLLFRRLLAQSLENCAGRWQQILLTALKGLGLYWLMNLAVTGVILSLEPEFANVNDQSLLSMMDESPLLMTLGMVFAAPLAEECLFRGWIFTGLAKKSLPLAYAVTCGFFSAAHIMSYLGTYPPRTLLLCFIQYLAPSFILCRTCRKADSLCGPLLLHMFINAIGCVIMR